MTPLKATAAALFLCIPGALRAEPAAFPGTGDRFEEAFRRDYLAGTPLPAGVAVEMEEADRAFIAMPGGAPPERVARYLGLRDMMGVAAQVQFGREPQETMAAQSSRLERLAEAFRLDEAGKQTARKLYGFRVRPPGAVPPPDPGLASLKSAADRYMGKTRMTPQDAERIRGIATSIAARLSWNPTSGETGPAAPVAGPGGGAYKSSREHLRAFAAIPGGDRHVSTRITAPPLPDATEPAQEPAVTKDPDI